MEEYVIKDNSQDKVVQFGKYCELVFAKHKISYGEKSANEIRERMRGIFKDTQMLLEKPEKASE